MYSQDILTINDLVLKTRADLSNLRSGNGNADTVHGRINDRLDKIKELFDKHPPEELGEVIINRVQTVRQQYRQINQAA